MGSAWCAARAGGERVARARLRGVCARWGLRFVYGSGQEQWSLGWEGEAALVIGVVPQEQPSLAASLALVRGPAAFTLPRGPEKRFHSTRRSLGWVGINATAVG